jgi:hypothetical protein
LTAAFLLWFGDNKKGGHRKRSGFPVG